MHVVGGVLGHAQGPLVREVEVHLGRALGGRGQLEYHAHPVKDLLLPGAGYLDGRRDQAHRPGRAARTQADPQGAGRALGQADGSVVVAAAQHRHPGVDVLRHRVLKEMFGREDRDLCIGIDHAEHPAEVVQVSVGVDDGRDGAVTPVPAVKRECRRRDLLGDQRVDDDDAVVAFYQCHVGHLEAADLVDSVGHLIQAVLGRQLGLPPQAGINGVRAGTVEEAPGVHVPDHAAIRSLDDHRLQRTDEAAIGIGEVSAVTEITGSG